MSKKGIYIGAGVIALAAAIGMHAYNDHGPYPETEVYANKDQARVLLQFSGMKIGSNEKAVRDAFTRSLTVEFKDSQPVPERECISLSYHFNINDPALKNPNATRQDYEAFDPNNTMAQDYLNAADPGLKGVIQNQLQSAVERDQKNPAGFSLQSNKECGPQVGAANPDAFKKAIEAHRQYNRWHPFFG